MSPVNTIPALEIKRRGIAAVDEQIKSGPVHVIKNNRPQYVVMTEAAYQNLLEEMDDAWALRIKRSLEEAAAGQVKRGTADELIQEIYSTD
ncbi:MAG: prevent-host-death protein [Gammaproteobacteria bacterium]